MAQLDELYAGLWTAHGDEFAVLDQSLQPRSWTFLFDVAASAGLTARSIVADAGCGRGMHCVELTKRFGCRVIGFDIVLAPMTGAAAEVQNTQVALVQADIERIPIRTGSVDFVWCRDMLVHVRNLPAAISECSRILRPGGKMLAWVTKQTELMEPCEARRLYTPLAIQPDSVSAQHLEDAFEGASLSVLQEEELGSELIQFYEERDGRASRELMRIARMRSRREQLVELWGRQRYESTAALYHWMIYHLLGKLSSGLYLLEKV